MQSQSKRGFTLIDLMVIVAIVTLIAAVIIPMLARSRENARKSSCLNNFKQLSIGFHLYTGLQQISSGKNWWCAAFYAIGGLEPQSTSRLGRLAISLHKKQHAQLLSNVHCACRRRPDHAKRHPHFLQR
jgi:uncharacterized protein involved in response to NO